MAAIPEAFPTPPPIASASFDYFDIADGTGVKSFYLANTQLSGSVFTSVLSQNVIYSADAEVSGSAVAGKTTDKDYDLTSFNLPQNLKGTAYVNIPHLVEATSGTLNGYLMVFLRKWDGTTETEIVSVTSKTVTSVSGVSAGKAIHNIPLVVPLTHFKRGEILRLTVQEWNDGTNGRDSYGIDPKDRTTGYLTGLNAMPTTQSAVYIPFVLKV